MPTDPAIASVRLSLRRFALQRDRWIADFCRRAGISRSDYDALEALDEHGPLTPGELGALLSLTSGSVTALVDRLERLGSVSRTPHPDDRRKVVVAQTRGAWRSGQSGLRPYLDAVDAATSELSVTERNVVSAYLDELNHKISTARDGVAGARNEH